MNRLFVASALLLAPAAAAAADPAARFAAVDAAVDAAIARGDCPGAVVVVVHNDAVAFRKAYGLRAKAPTPEPMTADTVFDLASLTKPVATAAVVWSLVDAGKLSVADPIAKHWPAFAANGKDAVTVEHCLLHTSGLTPDNAIKDYADGPAAALDRVAALKLQSLVGKRFRYSDVGFITLGVVAEKVGGKPLDALAREAIFVPLGMADTGYKPGAGVVPRVAPTGRRDGAVIRGVVHDPRALALGGVAGHAGLFGTADDLARFARCLLRGGELDGKRVLSADAVRRYTEPVPVPVYLAAGGKPAPGWPANPLRSRGWDVDTSFSAPRGDKFGRDTGFGHTGFTGTSIWVDPPTKTAVIVLTSRLHPDDKGNVTRLRREVGTAVAEAVGGR